VKYKNQIGARMPEYKWSKPNNKYSYWALPNGKYHHPTQPALVHNDGEMEWFLYGQRHRDTGPALMTPDNNVEWWWYGKLLSLDEYLAVNNILSDEEKMLLKLKYD